MKLPAGRQRALYVALGLVTLAWVADLATRTEPARRAQAATSQVVPASPAVPLDPIDEVEQVIGRLASQSTEPPAIPDEGARDPFAAAPPSTAIPPDEHAEQDQQQDPAMDFAERHRLDGVLAGPQPVAIVDSIVCPLGTRIDGFRLVRIEATRAVFERHGVRVELKLEPQSP